MGTSNRCYTTFDPEGCGNSVFTGAAGLAITAPLMLSLFIDGGMLYWQPAPAATIRF